MQVRSPQARFALLVRGEVWRWGCDELGRAAQRSCSASLVTHFISPLKASGHRVDVFLALDIRRAACVASVDELVRVYGASATRQVHTRHFSASTQLANFRSSLNFFRMTVSTDASHFTHLVVLRHDVQLGVPVTAWSCPPHRLGFAAYIDPRLEDSNEPPLRAEEVPSCDEGINDVMQWVPGHLVAHRDAGPAARNASTQRSRRHSCRLSSSVTVRGTSPLLGVCANRLACLLV